MFEQHRRQNEEWLDTQQKELDESRRRNAAEKVWTGHWRWGYCEEGLGTGGGDIVRKDWALEVEIL